MTALITADDRMAAIRRALANGNPELAHAIDSDARCKDCGAFVCGHGQVIDPDADGCFWCTP